MLLLVLRDDFIQTTSVKKTTNIMYIPVSYSRFFINPLSNGVASQLATLFARVNLRSSFSPFFHPTQVNASSYSLSKLASTSVWARALVLKIVFRKPLVVGISRTPLPWFNFGKWVSVSKHS